MLSAISLLEDTTKTTNHILVGLHRRILITVCGNIGRTVLLVKNGSWSRSRSFISAICEAVRGKGRPGGAGGLASVRPRRHRIISPRRRAARDACLRARSLRYAAGLRRAVTRHVWRDCRCYACVWCSVNSGYCVSSVVTMYMCWIRRHQSPLGFLTTQPVPDQLSR